MEGLKEIRASGVVIEVRDGRTGQTFRRSLPIDYLETASCLRLSGEDAEGRPSELVFFTRAGMGKLRDLTGGGADADPCGGHSA